MIGDARFTYDTRALINLVKQDLLDKLGNRELANFDLSVPGVFMVSAAVSKYPNPEVRIESVEDQIRKINPVVKPQVPRASDSLYQDADFVGGDSLAFQFSRATNTLSILGGPVLWGSSLEVCARPAHWVGVSIGIPLGISLQEGQIISYAENNIPKYIVVTSQHLEDNALVFYFDAAETTHNVIINWSEEYSPEVLDIEILAQLQDEAVKKVDSYPKSPRVSIDYPGDTNFGEALVKIEVDLSVGK